MCVRSDNGDPSHWKFLTWSSDLHRHFVFTLYRIATPLLALWSVNSLTNTLLHSLIYNAFSVTHNGFNVALGANVAECRKVRTITAYLRWRPVLKLRKEKKEMVAKKGRVSRSSGKEGRRVVRGSDTLLSRGCVFMVGSPGHRTQGYGFETINHPCTHTHT